MSVDYKYLSAVFGMFQVDLCLIIRDNTSINIYTV